MLNKIFRVAFLPILTFLIFTNPAFAQEPLKGRWLFSIEAGNDASLRLAAPFVFKKNGKGKIIGLETVDGIRMTRPFAFTELADSLSISFEKGSFFSGISDSTVILRSTIKTDRLILGTAIFVTNEVDEMSPTGFSIVKGTFVANKQE